MTAATTPPTSSTTAARSNHKTGRRRSGERRPFRVSVGAVQSSTTSGDVTGPAASKPARASSNRPTNRASTRSAASLSSGTSRSMLRTARRRSASEFASSPSKRCAASDVLARATTRSPDRSGRERRRSPRPTNRRGIATRSRRVASSGASRPRRGSSRPRRAAPPPPGAPRPRAGSGATTAPSGASDRRVVATRRSSARPATPRHRGPRELFGRRLECLRSDLLGDHAVTTAGDDHPVQPRRLGSEQSGQRRALRLLVPCDCDHTLYRPSAPDSVAADRGRWPATAPMTGSLTRILAVEPAATRRGFSRATCRRGRPACRAPSPNLPRRQSPPARRRGSSSSWYGLRDSRAAR